jgi:hypothetical protein
MFIKKADPWGESSFENLTAQTAKATQQVRKDIKEQVLGVDPTLSRSKDEATLGIDSQKEEKVEDQKQVNMAQTRKNLEEINMGIKKIKDAREKEFRERMSPKKGTEKKREEVEEKQKKDSLLQKILKGKQGSHEVGKGVSG